MRFSLLDRVIEMGDRRIVTIKNVSAAEEYLADHFPSFPVLPGVLMLEAMVQAARLLAVQRAGKDTDLPLVLGRVRALKYGRFVQPGDTIRIEVEWLKGDSGELDFRGQVLAPPATPGEENPVAASGRFSLRPATLGDTGALANPA